MMVTNLQFGFERNQPQRCFLLLLHTVLLTTIGGAVAFVSTNVQNPKSGGIC